jgi:hypothetical protein
VAWSRLRHGSFTIKKYTEIECLCQLNSGAGIVIGADAGPGDRAVLVRKPIRTSNKVYLADLGRLNPPSAAHEEARGEESSKEMQAEDLNGVVVVEP